MDHIKILKRAWNITWSFPALWVFGIILALTMGGRPSNPGNGNNLKYQLGQGDLNYHLSPQVINALIGIAIALACVFFILMIVGTILRYVSEVSLIRMVDQHEDTGEKVTWRQGFRLGANRYAFYLFVIDIIVGIVMVTAFLIGLVVAAAPLLLLLIQNRVLTIIGIMLAVGLLMLLITVFIVLAIAVNLTMQLIRRACVIEKLNIFQSIQRGFQVFRRRLGDILIMGIILFALGIVYAIVSIPVFFGLLLGGLLIAGLPAALIGWIVSLFASGAWPWIVAAIFGVPLFLVILMVPTSIISGFVQTFVSSTWTLTYREAVAMNHLPAPIDQSMEPA